MTTIRPFALVFAIMLCMAGAFVPNEAMAHAGPHGTPHAVASGMTSEVQTVMSSGDIRAGDELNRQCAAQMCCGTACYSGGSVITAEQKLPEPMQGCAILLPPEAVATKGVGPNAIRRPPRA